MPILSIRFKSKKNKYLIINYLFLKNNPKKNTFFITTVNKTRAAPATAARG